MIEAAGIIKPSLWVPGRNGSDLWARCTILLPFWETGTPSRIMNLASPLPPSITSAPYSSVERHGVCMQFDGLDDAIQCTSSDTDIARYHLPYTVFAYVRQTAGVTGSVFNVDAGSSIDPQTLFVLYSDGHIGAFGTKDGGAYDYKESNEQLPVGDWGLITLVSDGIDYYLYIDNQLCTYTAGSDGVYTDRNDNNTDWEIADGFKGEFNGQMGIFGFLQVALSSADVAKLAADPFCMIRQPDFAPFWDVTAPAGGGISIPVVIHHLRQQGIA